MSDMRSIAGRPRYFLVLTFGYLLIGLIIIAFSVAYFCC
jgi:hypothetical protein